jgi:hypothetical protein
MKMPIDCKIEEKIRLTLLIEGEDVFRFKRLIEAGKTGFSLAKKSVEGQQADDVVNDVKETLQLAENILQRFK